MTFHFERKVVAKAKPLVNYSRFRRLTNILVGIVFFFLLHDSIRASWVPLDTYSLTLAWDPSASPEVTSYTVYYGTATGNYTSKIMLDDVTTATISDLSYGIIYYFAITASDVDGVESDFSNEISYVQQLPGAQLQGVRLSDGQFRLTVTGTAGHTYIIEATADFSTWTVIGTGMVDVGGLLEFTDPDAANFQQRFYRTRDTLP